MLKQITSIYRNLNSALNKINGSKDAVQNNTILAAKTLINSFDYSESKEINNYEFKVFSQWGDDGIIQYLINSIHFPNKSFIEFGVENYLESNTRFLLINNNWKGLVIDGLKTNIDYIKNDEISWKFDLQSIECFVKKNNINDLLRSSGFEKEVGILSIDIDGNDFWIWQEINVIQPMVVICEYNSIFGKEDYWTIPYDENFQRTESHYSNLYYGSSLLSLNQLANDKGYLFIGCNSAGNNAYFVRKDKIGKIKPLNPKEGFVYSKFKESRSRDGKLTYLSNEARLNEIKGLPVYNTHTLKLEFIR